MSGGIFGIGSSALLAAQRALQVTGHNIANAGTEGYSRQRVNLETRVPQYSGVGGIGTGVDAVGVERVVDEFVELRLGTNLSDEAYQRTLAELSAQVDNALGDAESGLAPALQQFFNAVQDVASDPTAAAARQQLIASGRALVDRFAQLETRIEDQRAIANGRARGTVTEINELADGIAELNRAIVDARGRSGGAEPNDLLDKRDALVRDLAERISVKTLEQSDGSINVYVGQGQSLVVGYETTTLRARQNTPAGRLEIGFDQAGTFVPVTRQLGGGRLGALLEVGDTLLDPASNRLGRIAVSLAERFNAVHGNNMDLHGALGGDFFELPEPQVLAGSDNAAAGQPALAIADVGALRASDYELRFDGADWSVRRLADGDDIGSVAAGGNLDFDGLSLDMSAVSGAAAGDTFELRPMRAAGGLEVGISDPGAVAAALPVRAAAAGANAGTGAAESLTVVDPSDPNLRAPVDIEFTGGNYVAGAQVVAPDPSGATTITHNGWQVVLHGTPAEGDVFEVRDNAGGVGDNRGALALAALATERTLDGGTASFGESYAELVADVGVQTRRAELNADVQAGMLAEARAQRESASGVNLDEEAANLLRHQQAYQAAAQVITTAGTMFDTLLAAVRR